MKKLFFTAVAVLVSVSSWGQFLPAGYLTDETRPKDYAFILPPPSSTDGAYANDVYYYKWGRDKRANEELSEQALSDENASLYRVFGEDVIGITLSRRTTPEIIRLCERAASDANKANSAVKDEYQRPRPFVTFEEPSLNPDNDASKAESYSYPSGHASRGYAFALALCTVVPEHTSEIMLRAQYYALNRVVCGHHWKSDIDASLLLASAMFANIVCTDEYQQQLVKAREEYKRVKEEQETLSGEGSTEEDKGDTMRRFHMLMAE